MTDFSDKTMRDALKAATAELPAMLPMAFPVSMGWHLATWAAIDEKTKWAVADATRERMP